MKRLLALAAVLGMCGCVSLKTHREAVQMAEMRGKLEGQDQVLPLVYSCVAVSSNTKNAQWLAPIAIGPNDGYDGNVRWVPSILVGLRDDGVVIWRKK